MRDLSGLSYSRKFTLIAPYVTFRRGKIKELEPAQKAQITRYYHLLYGRKIREKSADGKVTFSGESGLLSRPTYHLKKVPKTHRRTVEKFAQTPAGYKKLRGALLPVRNEGEKPKVTYKRGKTGRVYIEVDEGSVERSFLAFEDYETEDLLITDNAGELVRRILKETKMGRKKRRFKIECGKHLSGKSFAEKDVAREVQRYFNEYKDTEKWCTGIEQFSYKSEKKFKNYIREEEAARKTKQKELKKIRKAGYVLKAKRKKTRAQ